MFNEIKKSALKRSLSVIFLEAKKKFRSLQSLVKFGERAFLW